jgi:hypothetical protein
MAALDSSTWIEGDRGCQAPGEFGFFLLGAFALSRGNLPHSRAAPRSPTCERKWAVGTESDGAEMTSVWSCHADRNGP